MTAIRKDKSVTSAATVITVFLLLSAMFVGPTTSKTCDPNLETPFHAITVRLIDGRIVVDIEPLALGSQCGDNSSCEADGGCPVGNGACQSCSAVSSNCTVLGCGENYVMSSYRIENGEGVLEANVTKTRLWKYAETKPGVNASFCLKEIVVVSQNFTVRSRELSYTIRRAEYAVRGSSVIYLSQDSDTYEMCLSNMKYIPADKNETLSLEVVRFNMTVTLSQHYAILSEVAKEMRKLYPHSQNSTLRELASAYHALEKEAKKVSAVIQDQLPDHDKEAQQSIATLRDDVDPHPEAMECELNPCPNGGGGGGSPPPSTCDYLCLVGCGLQDPKAAAMCTVSCFACLGGFLPLCGACIVCILVYCAAGYLCSVQCGCA